MSAKLQDKLEIKEVVENIGELQDRRQWDQLEQYFIEKPYIDRQSISGEIPAIMPRKHLITEWRRELQAYFYSTKHLIQRLAIKVSGNRAQATSSVRDVHFVTDRGDRYAWTVQGTWNYDLVKKAGRWQVTKMIFKLKDQAVRPLSA